MERYCDMLHVLMPIYIQAQARDVPNVQSVGHVRTHRSRPYLRRDQHSSHLQSVDSHIALSCFAGTMIENLFHLPESNIVGTNIVSSSGAASPLGWKKSTEAIFTLVVLDFCEMEARSQRTPTADTIQ